jgi:hypothetical protein
MSASIVGSLEGDCCCLLFSKTTIGIPQAWRVVMSLPLNNGSANPSAARFDEDAQRNGNNR